MSSTASWGSPVDIYKGKSDAPEQILAGAQGADLGNYFRENFYLPMLNTAVYTPPAGYKNYWEYVQAGLRAKGLSKSTGPLGVPTPQDVSAMQAVAKSAINSNQTWNQALIAMPAVESKSTANVKDYTPQYSKQISTAMKLKDSTDAAQTLSDAWYNTYGTRPSTDQIEGFRTAFNQELVKQEATTSTSTDYVTTYETVLDAKGKPTYDASGNIVKKAVTTAVSKTTGEGFTAAEQAKFLGDYIAQNFNAKNTKELAGNSKGIYDALVAGYNANNIDAPDFPTLAGVIHNALSAAPDAAGQKQFVDDYLNKNVRSVAAKKYAGIATELLAGGDAATYTKNLTKTFTNTLESEVTANDPLVTQALNYSDGKGGFRVANDVELNALMMNDPRYQYSSTAKHQAVSLADALMSKLGR